jgi:hypothetical protein
LSKELNIYYLIQATLDYIRLVEESFGCHSDFHQQIKKVLATYIPKLHSFEVSPDAFIGVSFARNYRPPIATDIGPPWAVSFKNY